MNVGAVDAPMPLGLPPLGPVLPQGPTPAAAGPAASVASPTRYGDAVSGDRGRMPLVDALFALHVVHARPAGSRAPGSPSASDGVTQQRSADTRQLAARQSSAGSELLTDRRGEPAAPRAAAHPFLVGQGLAATTQASARGTTNPLANQVAQAYRAVALAG